MSHRVNMADPSYEPTDADLRELVHEAFAHVKVANEAAQAKLRAEIAALRQGIQNSSPRTTK